MLMKKYFKNTQTNVIKILKGEAPHGLANPEVIKTIALMKTKENNRWSNMDLFDTSLNV